MNVYAHTLHTGVKIYMGNTHFEVKEARISTLMISHKAVTNEVVSSVRVLEIAGKNACSASHWGPYIILF